MICFFAFVLLGCFVSSNGDQDLVIPCNVDDLECLRNSTEKFLEQTSHGIPEHDIRPIDPLVIPLLRMKPDEKLNLIYTLENVVVTGLKDQKITNFSIDPKDLSAQLDIIAKLHLVGDITVSLQNDPSQAVHGNYTAGGKVHMTIKYPNKLVKLEDGKEHFEVGNETISCENLDTPIVIFSDDLLQALDNNAAIKEERAKLLGHRDSIAKSCMCKFASYVFKNAVHNIRAAAKILPKEAWFKNL